MSHTTTPAAISAHRDLCRLLLALALVGGTLHAAVASPSAPSAALLEVNPTTAPVVVGSLQAQVLPDLYIYRYYKSAQEAGSPAGFPNVEFCGGNDGQSGPAKRIYFEVHNRSSTGAPASQVRVRFVNPQSQQVRVINVAVTALAGQSHVVRTVTIPLSCYSSGSNGQCNFTLTADPDGLIGERFENNNVQTSFCVGPTF